VAVAEVRSSVEQYCAKYGVDPAMVLAVIRAESSGRTDAVSHAGALGLMQIMPATGDHIAQKLGERAPSRSALMEPDRNIRFGVYYFAMLQEQFGLRTEVLLAAYNAGPTRVQRWLSANQDRDAVSVVMNCPIPETRVYIRRVLAYMADERG
jgi:soluble lytic murein transglycosylase